MCLQTEKKNYVHGFESRLSSAKHEVFVKCDSHLSCCHHEFASCVNFYSLPTTTIFSELTYLFNDISQRFSYLLPLRLKS